MLTALRVYGEDYLYPESRGLCEAGIRGYERGSQPAGQGDIKRVPQGQVVPELPGVGEKRLQGVTKEGCMGQLFQDRLHQAFCKLSPSHKTAKR